MDIAIVVVAYNRPDSLDRLLKSLSKASVSANVTLYISIDGGGDLRTQRIADHFSWTNGEKKLLIRSTNLGLRDHVLACSDLVANHDGIIVLEDDLYVAPLFYEFAKQALEFYNKDDRIAGISLYTHSFNETAEMAFLPLHDGTDVFFLQLASSWGQCFSRRQWEGFRNFFGSVAEKYDSSIDVPPNVESWPSSSWKKHFIRYMVAHDLFFVYPRVSFCTNFGDKGVNLNDDDHFQVPLMFGQPGYKFCDLNNSSAVYDSYCEILPRCLNQLSGALNLYDYSVDLYGTKILDRIGSQYLLSTRTSNDSILEFGRRMIPHESNVIEGITGNEIHLAAKNSFHPRSLGFTSTRMVYFHRLPGWHKKIRGKSSPSNGNNAEKEEALLHLFSIPVYRYFFYLIIGLHRFSKHILTRFR